MTTITDMPTIPATDISGHKLIAVASGKGGVGKTWLSITMAHALARQGKKVLLFDGDLGLANIDVQLGMIARRDLSDVFEGNLGLANAITRHEEGGFDVIAGRSGHGTLVSMPLQRINDVIQQLRAMLPKYDAIIIDLGAGVDKIVGFMAAAADYAVVVFTDEPTSLKDAYAFIKMSHAAGYGDNLHAVVNMAGSPKEAEATYGTLAKVCQNFLKFTPPLLGIVRADKKVRDAIRAQALYLTRSPGSETAQDVEAVAQRLAATLLV